MPRIAGNFWSVSKTVVLSSAISTLTACSLTQLSDAAKALPNSESLAAPSADSGITTALSDALPTGGVPTGFTPSQFVPITGNYMANSGAFLLSSPGAYTVDVESYCLHVGQRAPTRFLGTSYLVAPLKGSLSPVITTLVNGRRLHPEIPQSDVQVLIWGLLLHEKVSELTRGPQRAAATLLSPQQLAELEAVPRAQELIQELTEQELARLPQPIQELRKTEQSVRSMLQSATATYADIERLAAPTATSADAAASTVPSGQWSTVQPGVFVRFLPQSYKRVTVQIDMPQAIPSSVPIYHAADASSGGNTIGQSISLMLGTILAVPTFPGQRLNPSAVLVSNATSVTLTQKLVDATKKAGCGGFPSNALDPLLPNMNVHEGSGEPLTTPPSDIRLPPDVITGLNDPFPSPGTNSSASAYASLYHELMHAAIDKYAVQKPGDPAWVKFKDDGTAYFTNSPMKDGSTATDPFTIFDEAAASYVGTRVATYVSALAALHSAAQKNGCPVSPSDLARIEMHYNAGMAAANKETGYEYKGLFKTEVYSKLPISPAMKAFIDTNVFHGNMPDTFAASPLPGSCNPNNCTGTPVSGSQPRS